MPATNGGSGQSSFAIGDLLYANSTTTLAKLAASTSGYVLTTNGAGTAPTWTVAGTVTGVTATAPVVSSGGAAPVISMTQSTTAINGYLSSTDFTTFNAKQPAGNYITALTSDVTLSGFSAGSATATIATSAITSAKILDGTIASSDLSSMGASTGQVMKWTGSAWIASADISNAGTVTSVTAAATANNPITIGGTGAAPTIDLVKATTTINGYLSSTDFTTFNNKQAGSTELTGVAALSTIGFVKRTAANTYSTVASIDLTNSVTGVLPATNGGSGQSSFAIGDLLYANSTTTLAKLAASTSGYVLTTNGAGTAPTWTVAGTVTGVTATAPVVSSGGAAPVISMTQSTTAINGYLSSTDFTTFNAKQPAGNYITALTSDVTLSGFSAGSATATIATSAITSAKILDGTITSNDLTSSVATALWSINGSGDVSRASGNVGIGTTVPDTKLDIAGAFSVREMAAPGLSPADQGRIYFDSTANKFKISEHGGAYVDLIGSGANWAVPGTIGSTTPNTGDFTTLSASTSLTSPALIGGTSTTSSITYKTTTAAGTTNADHVFQVGNNGATEAMRILNSGNVGIGTATPGYRLHVQDGSTMIKGTNGTLTVKKGVGTPNTLSSDSVASFDQEGGNPVAVNLFTGGNTASIYFGDTSDPQQQFIRSNVTGVAANRYLSFQANNAERMRINSTGNVGIGTTAPGFPLQVSGDVSISGNYKVNGVNIGSGTVGSVIAAATVGNPITVSSSTTSPSIDITRATASVNGYLASGDFSTFTNKQAGSTELTGVAALSTIGFVKRTAANTYSTVASIDLTNSVTGVLPATNGGSGQSSFAIGDLLYANSTSTLAKLAASTSGYVLTTNGAGTAPTWTAAGAGTVTGVTATAPVVSSGGTAPVISMAQSTTAISGYLSSTDFTTFNAKQPAGNYITALTSDVTLSGFSAGSATATIAASAVTSAKILDGTITSADLTSSVATALWSINGSGDVSRTSGNVGIGTASPVKLLDLQSSSSGTEFLLSLTKPNLSSGAGSGLTFGKTLTTDNSAYIYYYDDSTVANRRIGFGNFGYASQMVITNGGKVGIGTNSPTATLDVNGTAKFRAGVNAAVRVITAAGSISVTTADYIVCVNKTTGAATTVNLPASPSVGDQYVIKDCKGDANTNNITITPAAGNIDGVATYVINTARQSAGIFYDGTQWQVF